MRGEERHTGDLAFWGEWEPQSRVEMIEATVSAGPVCVHVPYYSRPPDVDRLQNTDPCVFGGFRYTCCQQHFRGKPSGLQGLAPGSLILFGSSLGGAFVLDTVFVIADEGVSHDSASYRQRLAGSVPDAYFDITLDRWYADPFEPCRLYNGATVDAPLNGMFSFFPAIPWAPGTAGFARPPIRIPDVISDGLTQNRKCTSATVARTADVWREVVRQVEEHVWLGVQAEMPPQVS
jgi:hypothetical protein